MSTTVSSYQLVAADLPRALANTRSEPTVAREAEYYLTHISQVKSIDDLLGDHRLFAFAMKAFGLEDMTYAKAFMRKVLSEGVDSNTAFARKLADTRYLEFAESFNFQRYGETATVFERTRQGTVDRYVRQVMEEDAGSQNEGVRLALYFQRKAATLTSAYGILADAALLKVAQTALGLPAAMSNIDIDRQAEIIAARLDIDDLKDPAKLAKFLSGFTARWDIANPSATATGPALLFSPPLEAGIGGDLLASLQNLRLGGA
ncbi:MAG TPA: DUF1217 domain-containing protein [Hyphomicrobiaceae bacterium]|nr:DUF1217 domain-containing protein [Hyphomicrobiaceae bacterium]